MPFRIFLRVGNDSSLGMLMVGFLALYFLRDFVRTIRCTLAAFALLYEGDLSRVWIKELKSAHNVEIVDE